MTHGFRINWSTALFLILLPACNSSNVHEDSVADQWAKTIQNFSLAPIYPLREDVRVGDIKLTVDPKTVNGTQIPYRDIGYMDQINAEIKKYYDKRPSFPKSRTNRDDFNGQVAWTQPTASESLFVSEDDDIKRLRLADFPGVTVATLNEQALSGRASASIFDFGASAKRSNERTLKIWVAGVEESRAPDDFTVFNAYQNYCSQEVVDGRLAKKSLENSLAILTSSSLDEAAPQIAIINRIYFARAIDYSFDTNEGFAADLNAVTTGLSDLVALSAAVGDQSSVLTASGDDDTVQVQAKQMADLVAAARSKIVGSTAPGLALSSVFVDTRGVVLREVYERPLAFAAQIIALDYRAGAPCAINPVEPGSDRLYQLQLQ